MLTNFHTKYKVECKIGEGSFSEVLKCQERSSGRLLAAKQLKKHFKSINHASEIPELMVLRKMSKHPNLLELYESYFDTTNKKVTLVFELMDMSLYDLMKTRKRPIPESRAKKYLYQIIKGIDHLHYHGIFHRDIKPENVLIKGEKVKISDMGSIKGFYSKQPYTEYISTRWYRSPECLLTKGFYGPKMDVWAIGCVYYELLTLKPLFPGSDELDQIAKINNLLGSPSAKLMNKLKKVKCRNILPAFPHKKGAGLNSVIPMMTEEGREIFKQMIVYDPDTRINVRRLLEHKYFNEIRHEEMLSQRLLSTQSMPATNCRLTTSPMWLSFITATRKRRIKRKTSLRMPTEKKHSVQKTESSMIRISSHVSSEVSFSNNSNDTDEPTAQVYAMKASDNKQMSGKGYSEAQEKFYDVQPDRIPGCEQYSKRRMLQTLGSKALAGLGLLNQRSSKLNFQSRPSGPKLLKYSNNEKESVNSNIKRKIFKPFNREIAQESSHPTKTREPVNYDDQMIEDPKNIQNQLFHTPEANRRMFSNRFVNSYNMNSKPVNDSSIIASQCLIDNNIDLPSQNMELDENEIQNGEIDMLPSAADVHMQISPKAIMKRKRFLSRFSDDEAVNLPKNHERRSISNTNRQDATLKRFHSGSSKTAQSGFFGPLNRAISTVHNTKELNELGLRTSSVSVIKTSSLTPRSMIKNKASDLPALQRRIENMEVKGAQNSLSRYRNKQ